MRAILGATIALMLGGPCVAAGVEVLLPPPISPSALPVGAKPKAVSLTRIAANIKPGTPWTDDARFDGPIPCSVFRGKDVTLWEEGNNKIERIETFDRIFRQELIRAGFAATGDPTNLFEDQQSSDLQVGALITDVRVRSCVSGLNSDLYSGTAVMGVEWQVYSVTQSKVVARIATFGGFELKPNKDGARLTLVTGVFGDNVLRLAANEQFRQLLLNGPMSGVGAELPATPLRFLSPVGPVPMATAIKSVVSIRAGDSLGSGVLISSDGYVLTNHHVVGSTGQVRVTWADGTATIGEVVRADSRRDVALVKTAPKASALPIRRIPAQVGEGVFAAGTPLRKEFANTLTRGIVSATRVIEGQALIQSDVAIDHGNSGGPLLDERGYILGLAVSGYAEDGVSRNINFFIPIDDALKALALTPAP